MGDFCDWRFSATLDEYCALSAFCSSRCLLPEVFLGPGAAATLIPVPVVLVEICWLR